MPRRMPQAAWKRQAVDDPSALVGAGSQQLALAEEGEDDTSLIPDLGDMLNPFAGFADTSEVGGERYRSDYVYPPWGGERYGGDAPEQGKWMGAEFGGGFRDWQSGYYPNPGRNKPSYGGGAGIAAAAVGEELARGIADYYLQRGMTQEAIKGEGRQTGRYKTYKALSKINRWAPSYSGWTSMRSGFAAAMRKKAAQEAVAAKLRQQMPELTLKQAKKLARKKLVTQVAEEGVRGGGLFKAVKEKMATQLGPVTREVMSHAPRAGMTALADIEASESQGELLRNVRESVFFRDVEAMRKRAASPRQEPQPRKPTYMEKVRVARQRNEPEVPGAIGRGWW